MQAAPYMAFSCVMISPFNSILSGMIMERVPKLFSNTCKRGSERVYLFPLTNTFAMHQIPLTSGLVLLSCHYLP